MNGRFWRKTLVSTLALLIAAGGTAVLPVADLVNIKASAVSAGAAYSVVTHDNGYSKEGEIYLDPENFNSASYFYYDKSIPEGTVKAAKSGSTVSIKLVMDIPVAMYDASGTQVTLTKSNGAYTFTAVSGKTYYLVRTYDSANEGNWEDTMLPLIGFGDEDVFSVDHDNGSGKTVKIELDPDNFTKNDIQFYSDKTFADGELVKLVRDKSSAKGLVMVKPGTNFKVYCGFDGKAVSVTKLASSDTTSDNYTFAAVQGMDYYVVKTTGASQEVKNPAFTYTKGDGSVTLSWDAVDGVSKYAVAAYVGSSWEIYATTSNTSYVLKGLTAGTNYKVAVLAYVDGDWLKDFSNAIVVTPNAVQYPEASLTVQGNAFQLSWTTVPNAQAYVIGYTTNGKTWKVAKKVNASTTSFVYKNTPKGTYYLVVGAYVGGKVDTTDLTKRAVKLEIK